MSFPNPLNLLPGGLPSTLDLVDVLFGGNGGVLGGSYGVDTASDASSSVHVQEIVSEAQHILASGRKHAKKLKKVHSLISELEQRLKEPYAFEVFPDYSVAYGLLYTFRQKWNPGDFQVGRLVATVPLAPRETRKIQKRLVLRESRQTKELRRSVRNLLDESTSASTVTGEIVKRAEASSAANVTAGGSYGNDEIYQINGSTSVSRDAKNISEETKKTIREKTVKAVQDLREERQIEVDSTGESTNEETSSGEISNPNEEITVTYLYYELGRQYGVSELLHKITPVIFVAGSVPAPDEINRVWLIEHSWILRRVLLDDSMLVGLDLLKRSPDGDRLGLQALQAAMQSASRAVSETRDYVATQERLKDVVSQRLDAAVETLSSTQASEDSEGLLEKATEFFLGSNDASVDAATARRDSAEGLFGRIEDGIASARSRLAQLESALEAATREYVDALRTYTEGVQHVTALRIHVKQNITYYMQAIWKHEYRDQRYFRLASKLVPFIPIDTSLVTTATAADGSVTIDLPPVAAAEQRRLDEIADIDNLLGFKGNYMIFPLKEPCHIATEMLAGFLDEELEMVDPDASSTGIPLSALMTARATVQAQKAALPAGDAQQALYAAQLERIETLITAMGNDSDLVKQEEQVLVPTDMLFVEALPGANPVLEHFKLAHRQLDVAEVRARVKQTELNNLRATTRLRVGDLGDPEIDRQIVINSNRDVNAVVDTGGGGETE